jgi:hypothetical protein
MQNFKNDLLKSKWTEESVEHYFASVQYHTQLMDHNIFPYDLTIAKTLAKSITVEVKALNWGRGNYPTGVLEIYQDDNKTKRPQWITHNDKVSIIAAINMADFQLHIFNANKLMEHFMAMELAGIYMYPAHQGSSSRQDCPGYTYKFAWQDKFIGHMFSTDLTPHLQAVASGNEQYASSFGSMIKALKAA